METIKSDKEVAQHYASQLANACQNLTDGGQVTKDTTTVLDGNTRNHEMIDRSASFLSQITSAIHTASEQLHSVASDFEAVDQSNAESFGGRYDG